MRRLSNEAIPHFQADQAWLSTRNACPLRTRPSAPGSVYGITLARILQVNSSMPLPCPEDNSGRAGPARTRIRAEALASPAPLITQPPVNAKQRQGSPVSKFPAGNTRRMYYSPSKDETRAGRRQNCAGHPSGRDLASHRGRAAIVAVPIRCKDIRDRAFRETVPRGEPTGLRCTPCIRASSSAFVCLPDP